MYKLGLIGYPLGHSISAVIQKAGFKTLGVEGEYDILETPPEELIQRIKYLRTNNYDGFNITIPLKVPMTLFLDRVDRNADIAGSVNTVKIMKEDKSFYGFNTDIYGFKTAIPKDINLKGKNVSVLGTGGAARAAIVALTELGVAEIDIFTRNIINSAEMADYLRKTFPEVTFHLFQIQNIRNLSNTAMVVNATPVGMLGKSADQMPIDYETIKQLNSECIVYDIIYNPIKTRLIEAAQSRGLRTINGLDMLVYQAAKALEIWTGKYPDTKEMKIAALEAL